MLNNILNLDNYITSIRKAVKVIMLLKLNLEAILEHVLQLCTVNVCFSFPYMCIKDKLSGFQVC